jgi:hypothetical protein
MLFPVDVLQTMETLTIPSMKNILPELKALFSAKARKAELLEIIIGAMIFERQKKWRPKLSSNV